ncbi:MAG: adenosylcobinamide-GDP ribazoletransferase [Tannerellaceae bacterium]|jgi:adenosylcobinamide-GDP ribazoletransferase|nr:adenosylcobinamide-GDP ribazoletransferase [Tannerellaceae bacterium]
MNPLPAALIFFTRLPFGRIFRADAESFRHILPCWPLTGWLTGGLAAAVLWLAAQALPLSVATVLALGARILLTGALHEDGWADFLDGFGGGRTREQTLAIMKDSATGTYGTAGLALYFLLQWSVLSTLPLPAACGLMAGADAWSKAVAAQLGYFLPYARRETESKSLAAYARMSRPAAAFAILCGLPPLLLFLPVRIWPAALFPLFVFPFLLRMMQKRLQAYTGDCCGATFVACEISFYAGAALFASLQTTH